MATSPSDDRASEKEMEQIMSIGAGIISGFFGGIRDAIKWGFDQSKKQGHPLQLAEAQLKLALEQYMLDQAKGDKNG